MSRLDMTIERGFTAVRFATPESYEAIATDLADEFAGERGIEIRQFNPQGEDIPDEELISHAEPGVRLLSAPEFGHGGRWWPSRRLAPILDVLEADIPELLDPVQATFTGVHIMQVASGNSFVIIEPNQDTFNALSAERSSVIYGTEQAARVPHHNNWHRGHLDMTVAFGDRYADPRIIAELAQYIGEEVLPLQIELDPVEFDPDPRPGH